MRRKRLTKHHEEQCLPSSGTGVKNYPALTGANNTMQVINLAGSKQTAMRSPTWKQFLVAEFRQMKTLGFLMAKLRMYYKM